MADKTKFDIYKEGESTLDLQLTILLVLTGRRWRNLVDERLRPIAQSSARMEAMAAIMNSPVLSSQVDIAKRLRIEGPTVTRMIDTLEKDSLVERVPHPTDRRTKQLQLTQTGEESLEEVFNVVDVMRTRLLDGFSENELESILSFLNILMGRLDNGLPESSSGK